MAGRLGVDKGEPAADGRAGRVLVSRRPLVRHPPRSDRFEENRMKVPSHCPIEQFYFPQSSMLCRRRFGTIQATEMQKGDDMGKYKSMSMGLFAAVAVCLAFARTAQCKGVVAVEGREPSLLPQGKKFKLVWNDEFDGDRLDVSKWSYRTNFWGQRAYWFATPEDNAVEVKDGLLHLKIVKKADGQFVSPQLQTGELVWDVPHEENPKGFWPLPKREKAKFMHRYGYYECRCRLQQMPGWWSAFWMQTPTQGCSLDPRVAGIEHDIMESFEVGEVIPHHFHANGYGADYLGFSVPRRSKDADTGKFNRENSVKLDNI